LISIATNKATSACGSLFDCGTLLHCSKPKGARDLPITRERKEELVAQYVELLQNSSGFAVIASAGMDVKKVQELRKKIDDAGGTYIVTKNTLLRIALEQAGWNVPTAALEGPTAVAIAADNFPGVAKTVLEYIKEGDNATKMQVKGGVMGGKEVLNAAGVDAVSTLPTLPEMQAQIIGLIIAPAQSIVNILNSADSGVVNVLQAWLDEKDGAA
jgi:large subunit ribosomal protein L10